jgi:hypothetical protein
MSLSEDAMTQLSKMTVEAGESKNSQRWLPPSRLERLASAIVAAETQLALVVSRRADPARVASCRALLSEATLALASRRLGLASPREYLAWDCLEQFDRQLVYLLPEEELAALWRSLRAEASEKLWGHRLKAVQEIAAAVGTSPPPVAAVAEVLRHLHTASQNQYHKMDQLRRQIAYVGAFLLVLVLGLLVETRLGFFAHYSPTLDHALQIGTLLGLVGGLLSVAFTVARTDEKGKIPALRASFEVAVIRPFIGAALALPVVLLVESKVVTIAGVEPVWAVGLACFLAGFSERWFLGLVEGLEKRTRAEPDRKVVDAR